MSWDEEDGDYDNMEFVIDPKCVGCIEDCCSCSKLLDDEKSSK